ncbi:DoxX [Vibrio aerogenes CECT 7868]|uniref:DoxX n=1 Tax=Vibrio aerogenes CECT 7868 TaxID=1216006 RepID=A0A1M5YGK9_9VIBR|nr:DoxX family protein [Vibrio aerogenes]SHI11180.1 DoxX [Vibrio aerogenes CECT 7868]
MLINPFRTILSSQWIESVALFTGRFALASVFWLSGQTKVDGFSLNLMIPGNIQLGWPVLKDSTLYLFEHEYNLPFIPFTLAAQMATLAEHVLPVLLLMGLMTQFAALGIFVMTLVIQIFVYPDAYATHATWLALSLILMIRGGGQFALDYLFPSRRIP